MPAKTQCKVSVRGETFPEMIERAKDIAARFFAVDESVLVVKSSTIAQAIEYERFSDPPLPCLWAMTVNVGLADEDDGNEFLEDDEDDE